jgi:hypothetical protein
MLPEFVQLKLELNRYLELRMRGGASRSALLEGVGHSVVHEGDRFTLFRDDGSTETKYFVASEAKVALTVEDILSQKVTAVARAVDDLGEQLTSNAEKRMIESVAEVVEATGNTTDAAGRPFSAELWLETLEKVEFAFDTRGEWQPPTVVLHPTMLSTAQRELRRLESEPELARQLQALVTRKQGEWRVREADRKLVD